MQVLVKGLLRVVILILFLCEVTFNPSTNYTVNLNLFQVYCSFVEKCLMDLNKNERMAPKKTNGDLVFGYLLSQS